MVNIISLTKQIFRLLLYGMYKHEHRYETSEEGEVVCSICGMVLGREEDNVQEVYNNCDLKLYQYGTLGTLEGEGKFSRQPDESKITNIASKLNLNTSVASFILAKFNAFKKVKNKHRAIVEAIYYALIKYGIFRTEEEVNEAVAMQYGYSKGIAFDEFKNYDTVREYLIYKTVLAGYRRGFFDRGSASRVIRHEG